MRVISYWKATRVIKHQTIAFSRRDNNFQGILESILTTKLGSDLVINWQPLWLLSILFCTVYNSCYFEGELVLSIMRCIEPSIINLKFPSRWCRRRARLEMSLSIDGSSRENLLTLKHTKNYHTNSFSSKENW